MGRALHLCKRGISAAAAVCRCEDAARLLLGPGTDRIETMMDTDPFTHDRIEVNGIAVHTVSIGEGPLVVFCHGCPESWYSWRHQLPAVADAGFKAVARDMRCYGGTGAPAPTGGYWISRTA